MSDDASHDGGAPAHDRVEAARQRLEDVDELPLEERADVFADVNAALAAELNDMEEV